VLAPRTSVPPPRTSVLAPRTSVSPPRTSVPHAERRLDKLRRRGHGFQVARVRRLRAILGFKRNNIPVVLGRSRSIYAGLASDTALFATPNPPLATFLDQIEALNEAQTQAGTGAKGLSSARDVKRDALWTTLELLLKYVQSLGDANWEQAESIFLKAGMKIARPPTYQRELLKVDLKGDGAVELFAYVALLRAGKGAKQTSFNWRYRISEEAPWVQPLSTPVGHIRIENLTPFSTVGFCVSLSDADGPGEWSQIVRMMIR
jgi:hypothetical protein